MILKSSKLKIDYAGYTFTGKPVIKFLIEYISGILWVKTTSEKKYDNGAAIFAVYDLWL